MNNVVENVSEGVSSVHIGVIRTYNGASLINITNNIIVGYSTSLLIPIGIALLCFINILSASSNIINGNRTATLSTSVVTNGIIIIAGTGASLVVTSNICGTGSTGIRLTVPSGAINVNNVNVAT